MSKLDKYLEMIEADEVDDDVLEKLNHLYPKMMKFIKDETRSFGPNDLLKSEAAMGALYDFCLLNHIDLNDATSNYLMDVVILPNLMS